MWRYVCFVSAVANFFECFHISHLMDFQQVEIVVIEKGDEEPWLLDCKFQKIFSWNVLFLLFLLYGKYCLHTV